MINNNLMSMDEKSMGDLIDKQLERITELQQQLSKEEVLLFDLVKTAKQQGLSLELE